ncbi:ABC transporter permease [Brachybacterium hainanense]|uniref:ABC transporter permease n=1 Tax=Brachybacterium hainanense TaxID=1541174 RepID=A0ABV6R5V8_9MICO
MRPMLDLRQLLDTRGGTVLTVLALASGIGAALLSAFLQPVFTDGAPVLLYGTLVVMALPLGIALPVLGSVMVASDWSSSSIQTTFLQRPRRGAVLASKLLAALILGAVVIAAGLLASIAATAAAGAVTGAGADYSQAGTTILAQIMYLLGTLAFGTAMGTLLQSTPLALVASLAVPFAVTVAGGLTMLLDSELVTRLIAVLDLSQATAAIADGSVRPENVGAVALLVLAPLVAGTLRWNRREIG